MCEDNFDMFVSNTLSLRMSLSVAKVDVKKVKKSISGSRAATAGRNAQQKGRCKTFVVMDE